MVGNIISLNKLLEGQKAVVVEVLSNSYDRRRLQDIGIINGTKISCVQKSFKGDPIAFYIRGSIMALRKDDTKNIFVQIIED